ncbi:hypothetical protein M0804_004101 [Polistes exclamans]|nr:hypothetical protein M0804_004101 [Polistes exclamans]
MQMRITQRFNRECGYGTRNESTSKNKPGRAGIASSSFTTTTTAMFMIFGECPKVDVGEKRRYCRKGNTLRLPLGKLRSFLIPEDESLAS